VAESLNTKIVHSSATSFDNVDPAWRTYCGLTANEVMNLILNLDAAGFSHSWKPDGEMNCEACTTAALPWNLTPENVEAWLAT